MEDQIWRFYDDLEGTSIMCESQEECEHLAAKFTEAAKKSFFKDCEDFFPFYEDVQFKEDDSITPMGYECTLYANAKLDLTHWGSHVITHRIAHYFYYHDRAEEAVRELIEKERIKKEQRKKPYVPPTLTAIVRGEVCRFVASSASPTDWTNKEDSDEIRKRYVLRGEELSEKLKNLTTAYIVCKSSDSLCGEVVQIPICNAKFMDIICKTREFIDDVIQRYMGGHPF